MHQPNFMISPEYSIEWLMEATTSMDTAETSDLYSRNIWNLMEAIMLGLPTLICSQFCNIKEAAKLDYDALHEAR